MLWERGKGGRYMYILFREKIYIWIGEKTEDGDEEGRRGREGERWGGERKGKRS